MTAATPGADLGAARRELRDRLVTAGRLIPTGVEGIFGRDEQFEAIVDAVDALAVRAGAPESPTAVSYPPMIPRDVFEAVGYLRNFPQLVGPVFTFDGDDKAHRRIVSRLDDHEAYSDLLTQSAVALTPACCYPVYPSLRGTLVPGGRVVSTMGWCFRHEPSEDPMRLQAFRMREHIRVATADEVVPWRDGWMERALDLLCGLGIDVVVDVANDPFFGRAGRLMSAGQREQGLKSEFLVDVYGAEHRTACASVNYHQSHFGELFGIATGDGEAAHSSCIGFGLERIAVALLATHGVDPATWPSSVRTALDL